jgi:hypothetical protein
MKKLNLALALAAVALLALSGIAVAKARRGDDHGHHGHHGHGRHHHDRHDFPLRGAGTIASFDAATGKLTITLTSGDSVAGLVTDATEIKCEGVDDRLTRRDHGGDDNGGHAEPGDDNGGRGEPEPGDDHGGQNEPGDDNGGEAPAGAPTCSTASLTPGEVVSSAELRLQEGTAVFKEVELGLHS